MILTEKAFFDYLHCPLYFHSKYALKVPLDKSSTVAQCIIQTIKFFYLGLLEGQVKTYKQLQNKWDALTSDLELNSTQLIKGWGKVVRIVEWSKTNQIIVADVNCKYNYASASHVLEGQIDFILVYPNHEIEILYFDLTDKKLDSLNEHKKLKYALDYFGFESAYGKKPDRIRICQPHSNTEIALHLLESDKKRLLSVIENTGESIKQKLYIPREGYMCISCEAKTYCRFYSNN